MIDMKSILIILILGISFPMLGQNGQHFMSTTYEIDYVTFDTEGNEISSKVIKPNHFHIGILPDTIYIDYDNNGSIFGNHQILTIHSSDIEKKSDRTIFTWVVIDETEIPGIFRLHYFNNGQVFFNLIIEDTSVSGFVKWI